MTIKTNIIALILMAFFASCANSSEIDYSQTIDETFKTIQNQSDVISAEQLAEIIYTKDTINYQFIDTRSPEEYELGHIPYSINIPAKHLLDAESRELLTDVESTIVFYCRDAHQAQNMYLVMKQIGYKNIKYVMGGFSYIKENILDKYSVKSGIYNDEIPRFDFQKIMSESGNSSTTPMATNSETTGKSAPVKKAKKAVSGGCG